MNFMATDQDHWTLDRDRDRDTGREEREMLDCVEAKY